MGGRGGSSGLGWKSQLRQMAKQGKMPNAIIGNRDAQSAIFTEIDRLYGVPQVRANIVDQGSGVWVNFSAVCHGQVIRQEKMQAKLKSAVS